MSETTAPIITPLHRSRRTATRELRRAAVLPSDDRRWRMRIMCGNPASVDELGHLDDGIIHISSRVGFSDRQVVAATRTTAFHLPPDRTVAVGATLEI